MFRLITVEVNDHVAVGWFLLDDFPEDAFVKQHGQDAPIHAAMRADAMLDKGDLDGYAVWKRILRAVEELQRVEPGGGARVN